MLVIVGPSASGKTEVVKNLIEHMSMKKLVTCTTRTMRVGETNDVDYHFLTKEDFEERIKNREFVEWQIYNEKYYGKNKDFLPLGIQIKMNKTYNYTKHNGQQHRL